MFVYLSNFSVKLKLDQKRSFCVEMSLSSLKEVIENLKEIIVYIFNSIELMTSLPLLLPDAFTKKNISKLKTKSLKYKII